MKLIEAMDIIEGRGRSPEVGEFLVHFEWREGKFLRGDYFPDTRAGEKPIGSLVRAWSLAASFATAMGEERVCNVYVVNAKNFMPVEGFKTKELLPR